MAKSTATPTDPKRVSEIAGKIHSACSQIGDDTRAIAEHQAEVQELSARINGVGGTRLGIVTEIAAMSHAEQWTNSEVVAACGLAVKMGNSQDSTAKTIGVFISEMKTFASPKVREQFPTILEACQNAWAEEQEYLAGLEGDERKGADTPVRKFKSRIYHLVIEIARRVKADDIEVTTAEDVVEWARAHDPDLDADKVAGKLAKVIADIDAIYTDFGQSDLKVAADFLRQVTVEELMAARKALQNEAPDVADVRTQRDTKPAQQAPNVADVRTQEVEPMTGVTDLDEFMNDGFPTITPTVTVTDNGNARLELAA